MLAWLLIIPCLWALTAVQIQRDVGWHSYTFDYLNGAHQWFHFTANRHTKLHVIKAFPVHKIMVDGQPWGTEEPCHPITGYLRYTGGRQATCLTGIIPPGDHTINMQIDRTSRGWDCSVGKNYMYLESMCRATYRRFSNWWRPVIQTHMFSCCAHFRNCKQHLATDLSPPEWHAWRQQ